MSNNIDSTNTSEYAEASRQLPHRQFKFLVPLVVFLILTFFLGMGLVLDPREVPSPLIGKPVPVFELPPVQGRNAGLSNKHLKGEVSLVNVFASWCTACKDEHPILMQLYQDKAVSIHGLNYKDRPQDAAKWLDDLGDPYTRTGADVKGIIGIDWGVYGVPETFVIDHNGIIAYKHIGAISPRILNEKLLPLIKKLRNDDPRP